MMNTVTHLPGHPLGPWMPVALSSTPVPDSSKESGTKSPCWWIEFRAGPESLPYLADHGFHDMVVLPGSFVIELVRQVHRDLFHREAASVRGIEFDSPVILSGDVTITIRAEQQASGLAVYTVFEGRAASVGESSVPAHCARMQVDLAQPPTFTESVFEGLPPSEFPDDVTQHGGRGDFYRLLRQNGNQYGPHFQTLDGTWRSDLQATGRFIERDKSLPDGNGCIPPAILDAAFQLLSAFAIERGRTFVLKSIDRLSLGNLKGPAPWWIRAVPIGTQLGDGATLTGIIQAVDAHGTMLWEISRATLAFIDPPASGKPISADETKLCIASTFTAEPLEESLRFWSEHFSHPTRVEFAPYNQVFQQLLDPASAFHRNRGGVNTIVLALEDWWPLSRHTLHTVDAVRAAACFGACARTVLPNGLEIAHLNRYETDYVYQEIFQDESYLRHDIHLADGDTVIDIGANIGLFSLFVLSRCKDPAIYAFEPSPRVFNLLQANCAAYGDPARVHAFNRGVAEKKGQAQFTFYEHSSVFSSFHPDAREDRAAVEAVVRNVMEHELAGASEVLESDVEELTSHRLRAETIDCPLTSVSDIIRENGLRKINLLKIDAEKSELGILRGIEEEHWPLIEQIVMEVHDRTHAAVQAVEEQLTRRGFRCAIVEEKLLEDSGLFNIYATRRAAPAAAGEAEQGLQRKVDEFCHALDSFATATSAPLLLAITPRTAGSDSTLAAAEEQVLTRAARHSLIRSISSQSIRARYPVRHLHDAHSHELGHMPFTPEGYIAIGTALSRAAFNIAAPPVKLIVADCDNTLWQGLCAEDGPTGISVTPPFRYLQEFLIRQTQAGALVALCSKNQEADVLAVFDENPGMPLRREHVAASRINWDSKPANLRALAAQLNLGLDSFAFLDDNPVECAAVRAACPEVTVLQLPADPGHIPAFLDNIWLFDCATSTTEDRERSQWYQVKAQREELQAAAPTVRAFLDGLQLRIQITEATDEQLARVAQLTQRTNQFNFTSIRRSEAEVRDVLKSGAKCLVTAVSDRFGDYGMVGAIIYTTAAHRYSIDTLLLSCRALGKGVEHRMVAELASRAVRDGKSTIAFEYRPTDRNKPAHAFLEQLNSNRPIPDSVSATLDLSATTLAELRYAADERAAAPSPAAMAPPSARPVATNRARLTEAMQKLGEYLYSIDAVAAAIESAHHSAQTVISHIAPEPALDATELEQALAAIWKKALGRTHIGLNENFFDIGGTSLKAVVVVAMIRKELKRDLPISVLVQAPTIGQLAEVIERDPVTARWSSLVPIRTGMGPALFCVHGVGGEVLGFRNLARHLDRPIYGLRARGLDGKQAPMDRVEDMAAAYIHEIRSAQPEGPYALIGFSLGGFIAFEMARQLVAQGQSIRLLGLLDPRREFTVRKFLLNLLLLPATQKAEFVRAALEGRARGGAIPRGLLQGAASNADDLAAQSRRIGAVKRGCLKAFSRYEPEPFEGRATLFRTSALLAPSVAMRLRFPWDELCRGGVEVCELRSDHWSVLQEPHVQFLAAMLEKCLIEPEVKAATPLARVEGGAT